MTPEPVQGQGDVRRLGQELSRLREVLAVEREAATRDMAAGVAELGHLESRVTQQRERIAQLEAKVQRLRQRAETRRDRIVALETELARYRSSRAVRIAARLTERRRAAKDGT